MIGLGGYTPFPTLRLRGMAAAVKAASWMTSMTTSKAMEKASTLFHVAV
jgi:hypothetical protein